MGSYIKIPVTGIKKRETPPTKTYRLDLEKGRISGFCDGIESVHQAIVKRLITPRFKCLIYTNQYGSELKERIISEDASPAYIQSEIPRLIKDALISDPRILDIENESIYIAFENDGCHLECMVNTIYGKLKIEEVF